MRCSGAVCGVDLVTKAIVESHARTCPCSTDDVNKLRRDAVTAQSQKLYRDMVRCHPHPRRRHCRCPVVMMRCQLSYLFNLLILGN